MDSSKIDIYMAGVVDKVNPQQAAAMRDRLESVSDSDFPALQSLPFKNPTILLVVSLFFGGLGIDRFLLGEVGMGVLKLITCGGLGIWTLVDWFLIMGKTKDYNFDLFMKSVR